VFDSIVTDDSTLLKSRLHFAQVVCSSLQFETSRSVAFFSETNAVGCGDRIGSLLILPVHGKKGVFPLAQKESPGSAASDRRVGVMFPHFFEAEERGEFREFVSAEIIGNQLLVGVANL